MIKSIIQKRHFTFITITRFPSELPPQVYRTSTSTMNLDDLPPEIIIDIVRRLDLKELRTLRFVSPYLARVLIPLIFRDFKISFRLFPAETTSCIHRTRQRRPPRLDFTTLPDLVHIRPAIRHLIIEYFAADDLLVPSPFSISTLLHSLPSLQSVTLETIVHDRNLSMILEALQGLKTHMDMKVEFNTRLALSPWITTEFLREMPVQTRNLSISSLYLKKEWDFYGDLAAAVVGALDVRELVVDVPGFQKEKLLKVLPSDRRTDIVGALLNGLRLEAPTTCYLKHAAENAKDEMDGL